MIFHPLRTSRLEAGVLRVQSALLMEPGDQHLATDFLFGSVDKGPQAPPPRVRGVRLDKQIGEGAFGVVWKGEQFEPVVRPVAVKILRMGALSSSAVKRFEAEKLALARLEHPHIARILDAGNTAEGAPYLVMEFVDGIPFDAWCHRNREQLEARLQMFVLVCRAIAYAHRQGILHRDLKPGNVLVRSSGSANDTSLAEEPKLIDFGVAKLVGYDALRTETRQGPAAATPAYMSPEIATGVSDIDGRVDVWSLGVMLYEALVGSRPFRTELDGMAGAIDLQKQITEARIPRPSQALPPNASRRLRAALEDELDWIVLRALERVPARRYTTPDELADEVERFLAGGNVQARPSTAMYRLRKLASRHRAALVVGGTIVGALTIAVGGLTYGFVRSSEQATRWREIARLNRSMLTALDPAVAQGLDPKLLKLVLVEAELELGRENRDPIVEAEVRSALGLAHAATGNFAEALKQFRRERELRIDAGAQEGTLAIRAIDNAIGHALVESNALEDAKAPLESAARGDDLVAANARHNLASLARKQGDLVRAEELLRDSIARKNALAEVPVVSRLETEQELALVLAERGRYADAEQIARTLYRSKLSMLGPRHPSTLRSANNLAESLLALGQSAEAKALLVDAIAPLSDVLGSDHEDTLSARNNLAAAMLELGDAAEASHLYEENRRAFVAKLGTSDVRSILAGANLAQCLALLDDDSRTESEFKTTTDAALRVLGPSSRITLANDANYAAFLTEHGRFAEAVVVLERAAPLIERELGRSHPQCLAARTTLARARIGMSQPARALAELSDAESLAHPGQQLTRIERRAVEIALEAARASGDDALSGRLERILAAKTDR